LTALKTTELPFSGKPAVQKSSAGQTAGAANGGQALHALDRMFRVECLLKRARDAMLLYTIVEFAVLADHLGDVPRDP